MGWILDVLTLVIIAFFVWQCARRGFVRTVIELVGYVAALVLSYTLSSVLSKFVYAHFIRAPLVRTVEAQLASAATGNVQPAVSGIFEKLPGFVANAAGTYGVSKETIMSQIEENLSKGASSAAPMITDYIAQRVIISLLNVIFLFFLFTLFMIAVRFAARLVNKVFNLPVLGTANRVLGAVVGVFKGLIVVFVITTLVGLILPLTENGLGFVTPEAVDNSVLFRVISTFNPLK